MISLPASWIYKGLIELRLKYPRVREGRGAIIKRPPERPEVGLGLVWLEPRRYLRPAMRDFLNGTAIKRFRMVWAEVPLWVVI